MLDTLDLDRIVDRLSRSRLKVESLFSALVLSGIVVVGASFATLVDLRGRFPVFNAVLDLAFAFYAACFFVYLLPQRKRLKSLSQKQITRLFIFLTLPYFPVSWTSHYNLGYSQDIPWIPFTGIKLAFLCQTVLKSGDRRVNGVLMCGFAIESVILWRHFNYGAREYIQLAGEPWYTILFVIVSVSLLIYQDKMDQIQRELFIARIKAHIYESIAHLFASLKDRSNTPLQTIEISIYLLSQEMGKDKAENSRPLQRISTAARQLKELNETFDSLGPEIISEIASLESPEQLLKKIRNNLKSTGENPPTST